MMLTFKKKKSYFSNVMHCSIKIRIFGTQLLLHKSTTVTSLDHNCHIFGTQPSPLWNTTCCLCGEESDYNTVTVLI